MASMDRRRLTVSHAAASAAASLAEDSDSLIEIEALIKRFGLSPHLQRAEERKSKFAAVLTTLDKEGPRKSSKTEKTQRIVQTGFTDAAEAMEWVHGRGACFSCLKGKKPESPNQDCFAVIVAEGEYALYCVLDGHGPLGHDMSHAAVEFLVKQILGREERTPKHFADSFRNTQQLLEEAMPKAGEMSGSTCTVVYHDFAKDTLTVAHVGDSRSILVHCKEKTATELTIDHKPNLPEEKKRIESANPPGRVVFDGYFNHRVFAQNGCYPGLNMSRALGDLVGHREAGLTAQPDIREVDLAAERSSGGGSLRLLICTDGVWEFITSQDASGLVAGVDFQAMVDDLCQKSWDNWIQDSNDEIADDITAVLVDIPGPPEA